MKVQIRYNTEAGDSNLRWRLLIDGGELLAREIHLHVPAYTSVDTLPDGRVKYHITAWCKKVEEQNGCYKLS